MPQMYRARNEPPQPVTVANGATVSSAVIAEHYAIYGLIMPAAFDGTALTFDVSYDKTNWQPLYDATNTAISRTVAAARSYPLPDELAAFPYFRLVCGTTQTADRVFRIAAKG